MFEIISDERARIKAAELILKGKTLESTEDLTDEMRDYIRVLMVHTAGKPFVLSFRERAGLLSTLEERLTHKPKHYRRPKNINFAEVRKALEANQTYMFSLAQMEQTFGAPDIIAIEPGAFVFGDCSAESPDRYNLTYDKATYMAKEFGVDMMSEEAYLLLQRSEKFDQRTWIWLATPDDIRESGKALCGERPEEGKVSVKQRDASDHDYLSGWRGMLRVPRV